MATAKTPTAKTTAKRPTVTKAAPVTTDNVVPLSSDLSTQLETLQADLKALAKTVKAQALAKVDGRTDTAKAVATEQAEAAKARYNELSAQAESSIREKPLSSMAMAVGAGLVLGAILRS